MNKIQTAVLSQYHFLLQILEGSGKGQSFRIFPPRVSIGRVDCNIIINDPKVSRTQCILYFKPEGIALEDQANKGNTIVNEKPVQKVILQHKDILQFGDTKIQFIIQDPNFDAEKNKKNFEVIQGKKDDAKEKKSSPMFYFLVVIIVLLLALILLSTTKKQELPALKTQAEINKEIEASTKIQEEIRLKQSQVPQAIQESKHEAQKHFIRGFRDYQNEQYSRALEAFRTALSLDPDHEMSKRYKTLSTKKRQELIDKQMELGEKYKSKNMYDRCAASFEAVLYIINNRKISKYQLAREKMLECQLLKGGNK